MRPIAEEIGDVEHRDQQGSRQRCAPSETSAARTAVVTGASCPPTQPCIRCSAEARRSRGTPTSFSRASMTSTAPSGRLMNLRVETAEERADVSATGHRRQIVDHPQCVMRRQRLQDAEVEGRAADAVARQRETHDRLLWQGDVVSDCRGAASIKLPFRSLTMSRAAPRAARPSRADAASGCRAARRSDAAALIGRSVLADDIGGPLGEHIDVGGDEESRYLRKRRGVDHAKPAGPAHAETPVQHRHRISIRSDRTTARRVVAPGLLLDERAQFIVRRVVAARQHFCGTGRLAARKLPDELDRLRPGPGDRPASTSLPSLK